MWREYSAGYLKHNPSTALALMLSAFISALLLSLLCGLFYNAWKYEVERIELKEGGWHSRITGELTGEDLEAIENFATVKNVEINERGSEGEEPVIDIYFENVRNVLSDTPRIANRIGVSPERITYHYELLAMYLIRAVGDTAPRLLFPMFLIITTLASLSLVVIIHNAFGVSMHARIHQFGIFSSIGATPRQIRRCLLQEAAALCALPVLAGNLLGIGGSVGIVHLGNMLLGSRVPGRHPAVPGYHPLVLACTLLVTIITVWISAWLPARRLSRLTPLEAIGNTGELQLERRRKFLILPRLFGVEAELAGNALRAQKKALRTASFSLICSFMAFTVMQCFFTLSGISTRETYFEKYQNAWDIMVTLGDTRAETFEETEALQKLPGVESAVVYQKAAAKRIITEEEMSEEMKAFGGFSHASEKDVIRVEEGWLVNAPLVILDDNSFLAYCGELGIGPRLDGAVILNRIRDVTNPDFRHPDWMPYTREENSSSDLRQSGREEMAAEIPVLSYTTQAPLLREEYATLDYYELVHFLPMSLWKEIRGQIGGIEKDTYIRVLGGEHVTEEELSAIQDGIHRLLGPAHMLESENRIQEYETNNRQIQGIKVVFGGFCALLAVIGIGNVFSNTLGFVRQRKREFARYLSVGMTPREIRNMFCLEALFLGVRPILAALPLAILAVWYMLKLSYVAVEEFLAEAPLLPILIFMLAILGFVALAYSLAWRSVRRIRLAEVLRDDTMI